MTETLAADRAATDRAARGPLPTVLVASLGILIAYLPVAGVSVVLGAIAADTNADTPDLQWVTAGYVLAMAAAVLSAGVIGDIYGRKRVLIAGFALMALGAVVAFLAGLLLDGQASIHLLWAGQAVMGLGGGALLTATLALVSHTPGDQHQRTRYMAVWAGALLVGAGVGPFLTGGIVAGVAWYWVFVPFAVLALVMIPVAAAAVKESAPVADRRPDVAGQVTAILAVAALVYGIIEGGAGGWGSVGNVVGLAVGAVMVVAFIVVERRSPAPLVRLDLFRSAGFSVSALAALVALFSVTAITFVLSLFFSTAQHLTVIEIAERTAFFFALAAIFGQVAARLQKVVAARVPLIAGLVIGAGGMVSLVGLTTDSSLADAAWRLALAGAGIGMVLSTVTAVAIHSVPQNLAGMAGATNTLFRQFGAALGPAVIGAVVTAQLAAGHPFVDAVRVSALLIGAVLVATAIVCAVALFVPARRR